jgi:hypothetical protein
LTILEKCKIISGSNVIPPESDLLSSFGAREEVNQTSFVYDFSKGKTVPKKTLLIA